MKNNRVLAAAVAGSILVALGWPADAQAWGNFTHAAVCYQDYPDADVGSDFHTYYGIRNTAGSDRWLVCPIPESTAMPAIEAESLRVVGQVSVSNNYFTSRVCHSFNAGGNCRSTRTSSGTVGYVSIEHGASGYDDQQILFGNAYYGYLYVTLKNGAELAGISVCDNVYCT